MPAAHQTRKAVFASAIGNVLEWYDFGVYVFFAAVIAKNFFPHCQPDRSSTVLVRCIRRGLPDAPTGIVIGRYGDTHSRKAALTLTIMSMAFGTVIVGVLPGYASIGVAAPVLLVIARLIQGFSAGGEWGGSTAFMVEWAPHGHRGWYGSFQQASIAASLVLASGIGALSTTILSADDLTAWGWRLPFLLGISLALVGVYLRRNVDRPVAFAKYNDEPSPKGPPQISRIRGKTLSPNNSSARSIASTVPLPGS